MPCHAMGGRGPPSPSPSPSSSLAGLVALALALHAPPWWGWGVVGRPRRG